jgi:hypothetical protein
MMEMPISIFTIQVSQGELRSVIAVEPDTAKTEDRQKTVSISFQSR